MTNGIYRPFQFTNSLSHCSLKSPQIFQLLSSLCHICFLRGVEKLLGRAFERSLVSIAKKDYKDYKDYFLGLQWLLGLLELHSDQRLLICWEIEFKFSADLVGHFYQYWVSRQPSMLCRGASIPKFNSMPAINGGIYNTKKKETLRISGRSSHEMRNEKWPDRKIKKQKYKI